LSASPEPAGDAELACLLDAYAEACDDVGYYTDLDMSADAYERQMAARAALLDYLAEHYVRRDAIYDEWDHLDTTAPSTEDALPVDLSALRFRGDGPTLADVKRAEAAVLIGRGPARAARYSKGELADGSD